MCIFDQIYHHIPCVKNFFAMRANYYSYVRRVGQKCWPPNILELAPPITSKIDDRTIENTFKAIDSPQNHKLLNIRTKFVETTAFVKYLQTSLSHDHQPE
jgi:hypothetical protein